MARGLDDVELDQQLPQLRTYFNHVDKIVGVKKDCAFNTVVTSAKFDTDAGTWLVQTGDGRTTKAKSLVLGTRFVSPFLLSSPSCWQWMKTA